MNVLILGGGVFVGRHLVEAALAAGHAVTTFSRGREDAPPGVEALIGDRRGDLSALRGRRWDAAIDVAAYVPSVVRAAGDVLADAVDHYTLVSTRSVYADLARCAVGGPVAELSDADLAAAEAMVPDGRSSATLYGRSYGGLKVRCEQAAAAAFGQRLLVIRPGLIVGPRDPTDRFTYWPARLARGGDVLAPGAPDRIVRFVDARDLAAWAIDAAARRLGGTFDVTGADGVTMGSMLDACRAPGVPARLVWADEAFLLARGVAPWSELPLWIRAVDNAFLEAGNDAAVAAGLTFRSVADTARDTRAWDEARGPGPREAGLAPDREAALLGALRVARSAERPPVTER
ncbi:MAG: NAD-dependent epimerase/dehydratase family protein [Myxococcota bacterium]